MSLLIKLPNFFESRSLNNLKRQMGIEKHVFGAFGNSQSKAFQLQLETAGVDIENLSQLTPLDDHTLTFKNQRIILYIRDVNNYSDELKLPKFHVAYCSTLQKMHAQGRNRRYVVSQNENDIFHLNLINRNAVRKTEQKLDVCRNCLELLHWNNYSQKMPYYEKNNCVSNFKISEFFSKYPKSIIKSNGYSQTNSPINIYNDNWKDISNKYRESKRWICEECSVRLSNHKKLLHTHHINGQKNDNSKSNLKALCVECHSNQYMHDHMHSNPDTARDIISVRRIRVQQSL